MENELNNGNNAVNRSYGQNCATSERDKPLVEIQNVEILKSSASIQELILSNNKNDVQLEQRKVPESIKKNNVESWLSNNYLFMCPEDLANRPSSSSEIPNENDSNDESEDTDASQINTKSVSSKKHQQDTETPSEKSLKRQQRDEELLEHFLGIHSMEDYLDLPLTSGIWRKKNPKRRKLDKKDKNSKNIKPEELNDAPKFECRIDSAVEKPELDTTSQLVTAEGFLIDKKTMDKYWLLEVVPGVYRSYETSLQSNIMNDVNKKDVQSTIQSPEEPIVSNEQVLEDNTTVKILSSPELNTEDSTLPIDFEAKIDALPISIRIARNMHKITSSQADGVSGFQKSFENMLQVLKIPADAYPFGDEPKLYKNPTARQIRSKRTKNPDVRVQSRKTVTLKMPTIKLKEPIKKFTEYQNGEPYEVLKLGVLIPTYDIFGGKWNKPTKILALNETRGSTMPQKEVNWGQALRNIDGLTTLSGEEISIVYNENYTACGFLLGSCIDLKQLSRSWPTSYFDEQRNVLVRRLFDRSNLIAYIWHCGSVLIINAESNHDAQLAANELSGNLKLVGECSTFSYLRFCELIECQLPWSVYLHQFSNAYYFIVEKYGDQAYVNYVNPEYKQCWVRIYENGMLNLYAITYSKALKIIKHLYITLASYRVIQDENNLSEGI